MFHEKTALHMKYGGRFGFEIGVKLQSKMPRII